MRTRDYYFSLDIYYHVFQNYYSGAADMVMITTDNGVKIKLPAHYLRPFITHAGIRGRFRITLDEQHKVKELKQLS